MKSKLNIRLIINSLCLCLCVFLLISTMFAWYVQNTEASANGISAVTDDSDTIIIEEIVKTKRYNLNGNIISSEYTRDSYGNLYLTKKETYIKKTDETVVENHQASEKIAFFIETMLPGEYIDITFGFKLKESLNGSSYRIKLNNISGDSFMVDEKIHYASGAFKYKNVSLGYYTKDAENNSLFNEIKSFTDEEYKWFNTYDISKNDDNNFQIVILEGIWNSYNDPGSDESLYYYYTFRIMEDFTQYYDLISKASGSYGALLSDKNLIIKEIYFMLG